MPTADASTPAPTYGTLASSSSPWIVPSSPYGPCSTGKIDVEVQAGDDARALRRRASSARSIERIVSSLGRATQVHFAAAAHRPRRVEPRLLDDLRRRDRRRRPSASAQRRPSRSGSAPARSAARSRLANTAAADASDTSCSPDRPPYSTPTRSRFTQKDIRRREAGREARDANGIRYSLRARDAISFRFHDHSTATARRAAAS